MLRMVRRFSSFSTALGVLMGVKVVLGVVSDHHGVRVVLLTGLGLASVALLPKREIKIVTVQTDPVSLTSLCVRLDHLPQAVCDLLDRGVICFHFAEKGF